MTPTVIFLNVNDTKENKHLDIVNGLLDSPTVLSLALKMCEQFKNLSSQLVILNFVNGLTEEVLQKTLNGQRLFKELNLSVVIR